MLNGNFIVTLSQRGLIYEGVSLDYSGAGEMVERLNCSRPLHRELLVQVLGAGPLHPPDIHWEYTVHRPEERFRWAHADAWTACDEACNGERRREEVCVRLDTGGEVPPEYCSDLQRPAAQTERCNPCTVK